MNVDMSKMWKWIGLVVIVVVVFCAVKVFLHFNPSLRSETFSRVSGYSYSLIDNIPNDKYASDYAINDHSNNPVLYLCPVIAKKHYLNVWFFPVKYILLVISCKDRYENALNYAIKGTGICDVEYNKDLCIVKRIFRSSVIDPATNTLEVIYRKFEGFREGPMN